MNDLEMLSIIVPFYNSEDFLDDCIKSIITQRYNNIELILVNDGSVDKSEDICKRYQNIDDRVKYYKFNTNRGVSFARNFGIMKLQLVSISLSVIVMIILIKIFIYLSFIKVATILILEYLMS